MPTNQLRHLLIGKKLTIVIFLSIFMACAGTQDLSQKGPVTLPLPSFVGYQLGPIIRVTANSLEEIQARVLYADSINGFIHVFECTSFNNWKCYTAFRDMNGLIPGLAHHRVLTSLRFTVAALRNNYEIQIDHRTVFATDPDEHWGETTQPKLHMQIIEYLKRYDGLARSRP